MGPIHSCKQLCGRSASSPGDPQIRAAARCNLPDFDPEEWSDDPQVAGLAEPLASLIAARAAEQDIELGYNWRRDGCPWAWAQCRYAQAVAGYAGVRDASSRIRQPSLRMRKALQAGGPSDEVLAAVEVLEAFEDGAYSQFHDIRSRPPKRGRGS